ncbi:hypothetical protein LINPERHAP2_LOCUS6682 [Linum perenne]
MSSAAMGSVVEPSQLYSDNPESLKKSKKKKRNTDMDDVDYTAAAIIPPRTMNVKIELIQEQPDRTSPVVGYFPSGYNQSILPRVNLYKKNVQSAKIEEKSSIHRKVPQKLELVVTPDDSKIDFVGTSYKGEASNPQLADYALGVLDKDTNTLKIMPIAGNKILRLEPILRARAAIAANEEPPTEDAELTAQQKAAKKRSLLDAYSTKKSIARNKKMHNLTQGLDQESLPDCIPVNKEAVVSTAIDVARNIPPYNASATIPKEAYPLDKIVEWEFLKDIEWKFLKDIEWFLQSGEVINSTYPVFVRNRIHKLKGVQDDSEKATLSRILCYITHLVQLKNSERVPRNKLNLLISYVLVLVLHFDDFKTDPADITKDLRKNIDGLRKQFENLGCKFVAGENKVRVATLPVPIRFPEAKRRRGKRN